MKPRINLNLKIDQVIQLLHDQDSMFIKDRTAEDNNFAELSTKIDNLINLVRSVYNRMAITEQSSKDAAFDIKKTSETISSAIEGGDISGKK